MLAERAEAKLKTKKLIESTQMKYNLAMQSQLMWKMDNLQARVNALLMDMCRQQPRKQPTFPKFSPIQLPRHRLGGPTRLRPTTKIPPLRLIGKRKK